MSRVAWADGGAASPLSAAGTPTAGYDGVIDDPTGSNWGSFKTVYGGLVGATGGATITFSFLWTPAVADATPVVTSPITVGGVALKGFSVYNNNNPAKKGVMIIRCFVNGVECDNHLAVTTATSGNFYGSMTFEEIENGGASEFWTQFAHSHEVV